MMPTQNTLPVRARRLTTGTQSRKKQKLSPRHLLARAAGRVIESLETRQLMAVSLDANGWTVVTPAADSLIVYVSSSQGSDANSGLSADAPMKSINAARTKLRNNSADQLLLKRGDVFREAIVSWELSGRSAQEPIVIGSYGTSSERPLLKTGTAPDGFSTPLASNKAKLVSHFVLQGIAFEANFRNTDSSEYDAGAAGGTNGFRTLGQANDFLIEDCSFKSYSYNIVAQSWYGGPGFGLISDFKFRRNLVLDAYTAGSSVYGASTNVKAEGMYVDGVEGLLLEGNVFDHNGWNAANPLSGPNIYNHNVYIQSNTTGVVVKDNIFANAASHGLQARSGGTVQNNLFLNNAIGMSYGLVNGIPATPGGVRGEVSDNVFIGGRDISGEARGWAIEIANVAKGGNTSIHDNIFTSYSAGGFAAMVLTVSNNSSENHAQEVGIHDLTIADNVFNAWSGGINISKWITGGTSGYTSMSGLVVRGNDFRSNVTTNIVDHSNQLKLNYETWSGNNYDVANATDNRFKLWTTGTAATSVSFNTWNSSVELGTATRGKLAYVDPNRSAATYNAALGGSTSTTGFLAGAREQSRALWRSAYTTSGVNGYVRAGFSTEPETDPVNPGEISVAAPDITAAGSGPLTITVTFKNGANLDPASLDSTDLRVTGPNGFDSEVTFTGIVPTQDGTLVAQYALAAPANGWGVAGNGTYKIVLQPDAVLDLSALPAFAGGLIGTFKVNIDIGGPQAMAHVEPVVTATQTAGTATVRIGYSDPAGVNISSLDSNDIRIVRQSGSPSFNVPASFVSCTGSGTSVIATYRFNVPSVGWQVGYNGMYDIVMAAGQVTDGLGKAVAAGSVGSFRVNVETTKPTVTVTTVTPSPRNTAVASDTIVFSEKVRSVDLSDLSLTRDGVNVPLTALPALTSSDGITWTINLSTVTTAAGSYTLGVKSGTDIIDMAGNALSTVGSTSFVIDKAGPTATLSAPTITTATTAIDFNVTYADGAGINGTTLDGSDVRVTGPFGFDVLAKLRSIGLGTTSVTATYGIDLPAGQATFPNGTYTVTLQTGAVSDGLGNTATGATLGTFNVAVTAPPLPVAQLNGPSTINEGDLAQLTSTGSKSMNGTALVAYQWDLSYNGITFDVNATGPTLNFPTHDSGGRTVALRVVDASGLVSDPVSYVGLVNNVAPTATFTGGSAAEGSPSTVTFTNAADVSSTDTAWGLKYSYDFNNDGDFVDLGDIFSTSSPTAGYTFNASGEFTIHGRVSDKDGGYTDYTALAKVVPVVIEPPIAVAGGPYTVVEGANVSLDGSLSTTADGFAVSGYEWDFNYDGVTFDVDASGAKPTFSAGNIDGPATRVIALRVSNGAGTTTIASTQVTVTNAAPTATGLVAGAPVTVGSASTVSLTGGTDASATDVAAGLRYSFDFNNDGDFSDAGDVAGSLLPNAGYTYAAAGTYTVRGRIADDDGGFTDYTTTVVVNPVVAPITGSISGVYFNDLNGNGVKDGVDIGLANRDIFIDLDGDNAIDAGEPRVLTTTDGAFTFTGLNAGTYKVRRIMPATWVQTTPLANVTLTAGQNVTGVQIGGWQPPATISGIVFNDTNGDGVQNGTETRAASRVVFLDLDGDNALDTNERSVTTTSTGAWSFDNLAPGTHRVRQVAPAGYTSSMLDPTVTAGQVLSGLVIATKPNSISTGSLKGYLFNDNNKNGTFDSKDTKLSGKVVFLDSNNNGRADGGEKTSVTDSLGNFSFTGLAAGTYRVRRTMPVGYTYSTPLINFSLAAGQAVTGLAIGSKTV